MGDVEYGKIYDIYFPPELPEASEGFKHRGFKNNRGFAAPLANNR